MEQESDRYAGILQRLSPEVQQEIRYHEEHPVLPDWPAHTRGVPNIYLRSALFGVIKRGKRRAVKKETIGTFKGLTIRYTGWQLDQGDLDVLVQSLHLHKYHLDPDSAWYIRFTVKGFLRSIGRQPGKSGREWLKDSLRRLKANALEITTEIHRAYSSETITYAGSLVDEFYCNEQEQSYFLKINPKLAALFNAGWTQVQWKQRLQLKADLAKWLHGFYASHRDPFPIKVTTLKYLCGSDCNRLTDFRRNLRFAMNELIASSAIDGWEIDAEDKVHVQKPGAKIAQKLGMGGGIALTQGGHSTHVGGA
ncbi:MAG: plasmid replication initiator TrfA, partial [Pseudomonadota bacterium]